MTISLPQAMGPGSSERRGAIRAPRLSRANLIKAARWAPGIGLGTTYLSLVVLIPIAAVFSKAFNGGLSAFWSAITDKETASALELTVVSSFIIVVINAFAGTAIAWLLVRDRFRLNRVIGAFVDLPFALPTVIAGITLITVYGPTAPLGVNIAYTRLAIIVALAFVTLPFSVRSVQPVLAALDQETEEAAASLGASPWVTFRRVTLPSLMPAILTGAGLGFARALGEYGSVVLVSGDLPFKTEMASVRIFELIQNGSLQAASATSLVLFVIAAVVLAVMGLVRRRFIPKED